MKKISWKKHAKLALRIISILGIIIVLFCGWATQQQESINSQLFAISRVWNGIGVLFLLVAWGFWEWFLSSKDAKSKIWKFTTAYVLFLLAVIFINGILGLVFGFITLAVLLAVFLLDHYSLLPTGSKK